MGHRHRCRRGRPLKPKVVSKVPEVTFFKPRGIMLRDLEIEVLTVEELEAFRLVDHEGLEQEEAAKRMKISRKTLWRLLESARKKVAKALIDGKAIEIKGGAYVLGKRIFECFNCGYVWEVPRGVRRPTKCLNCGALNIRRKE